MSASTQPYPKIGDTLADDKGETWRVTDMGPVLNHQYIHVELRRPDGKRDKKEMNMLGDLLKADWSYVDEEDA